MGHKTRSRKLEAAARSQHTGLFRSGSHEPARTGAASPRSNASVALASAQEWVRWLVPLLVVLCTLAAFLDRKSTRLNSSHLVISYAVFCLKKKKKNNSTISAYMVQMNSRLHT